MLGYKKRFTVWVHLDQRCEYVRIPREYHNEGTAMAVYRQAKKFSEVAEPILMQEETATYSDRVTREPYQFTQYTALL
jgi:hypothetical protein